MLCLSNATSGILHGYFPVFSDQFKSHCILEQISYFRFLFLDVPSPPVNVTITDCKDWRVELHWLPSPSTAAPITYYLIEQESSEDPVIFGLLYNVSTPDATSKTFNVRKDSSPRFRIRAVNNVGKSLPSSPVNTTCQGTETDFGMYASK